MRRLLLTLIGIAFSATAFTVVPQVVSADGHQPGVLLIAVDLGSTSVSENDAAVAETALRILVETANDGTVALMPYSDEAGTVVGHPASGDELNQAVETLIPRISSRTEAGGSDQYAALAAIYGHLSDLGAPAGSEVFLITGRMQDGSTENRERIVGFADLFVTEGWSINAVMLPSSTNTAREFITSIVDRASGRWDDTGTLTGIDEFADNLLGLDGDQILDISLPSGNTAVQAIEIAPESTKLSVSMVRSSSGAAFNLFDPYGVQLGETSNAARFITTPNLLVATITSPDPGTWSLRATGDGMPIMSSVDVKTPVELTLVDQPPFQAGQQSTLMAMATVDGQPRWLPQSNVMATVTSPDGASVIFRLTDNGEGGDAVLGDGVFSVVFESSPQQGFNDVDLELGWNDFDAKIKSKDSFQTELFPVLQIEESIGGTIDAGNEIVVAKMEVRVGEYPHPVLPSALTAVVSGPGGEVVDSSLRMIDPLTDGTAWTFEVLAKPMESGDQTVTAELADEYVGRMFTTSSSLVQVPVTVDYPVIVVVENEEPSQLIPIIGVALIALLVIVGGVLFLIARRQVVPYGYIYNDRQELVLDLSSIGRSGLNRFLSKGVVSVSDAPEFPVPGGRLIFKRSGPEIHYDNTGNATMRIDGRPAARVVELRDGSRIGFSGRLFEFSTSRRRVISNPAPEPDASVS